MKKFILPVIILLTVVFFSPQKVNAQTDPECYRVYQNEGYKCLQTRTKCTQSCSSLNNLKACHDGCSAQDKTCSEQASADLTACNAVIAKDKEAVPSTAESGQDCRKIFDRESYKCLGVSGDCQRECSEETKRPDGGTYFNSGEIYSKCTKVNDCDGKGRACNEQALANFRACGKSDKPTESKKETSKQSQNSQDSSEFKLPVFVGEWFNAMIEGIAMKRALLGFASFVSEEMVDMFGKAQDNNERKAREYLETLSDDYIYSMTGLRKVQLINMRPSLSDDVVQKLVKDEEAVRKIIESSLERPATPAEVIDVPGESDIKVYPFGKSSVAVIESPNWKNIKFREPVEADRITSSVFELEQGAVEVKVKNDNPSENKFGVDAGWLGVTVSRTHFYVYKNPNGKSAAVIVYEGEVQVKTMGGKTINVKPDDGEPGMLVVSRKLSPIKLGLTSLVALGFIGGIAWFIKKKSIFKASRKNSR